MLTAHVTNPIAGKSTAVNIIMVDHNDKIISVTTTCAERVCVPLETLKCGNAGSSALTENNNAISASCPLTPVMRKHLPIM
jgi:hypothetical protein